VQQSRQELKSKLKAQGTDLITYHRKIMKSIQLSKSDEYHLKQRNKIETLFSLLKGRYNLVTSKARSIEGHLAGIYDRFVRARSNSSKQL